MTAKDIIARAVAADDWDWPEKHGRAEIRETCLRQAEDIMSALAAAGYRIGGPGEPVAWQSRENAPHACHVLATYWDEEVGERIMDVVLSPPAAPYTHWRPLPLFAERQP